MEPYARFRSMKRLNYFGIGNETALDDRPTSPCSIAGSARTRYIRPVGWLAVGARSEGLWERTSAGESPEPAFG